MPALIAPVAAEFVLRVRAAAAAVVARHRARFEAGERIAERARVALERVALPLVAALVHMTLAFKENVALGHERRRRRRRDERRSGRRCLCCLFGLCRVCRRLFSLRFLSQIDTRLAATAVTFAEVRPVTAEPMTRDEDGHSCGQCWPARVGAISSVRVARRR